MSELSFYTKLRNEVLNIIEHDSSLAYRRSFVKTIILLGIYGILLSWLLRNDGQLPQLYLAYALLGLCIPLLVVNLGHDAVHGSLFKQAWANNLAAYSLELGGADHYLWNVRHVRLHHPNTNIIGMDVDLAPKKIFWLTSNDRPSIWHRYQHVYLPFVFSFYTLFWIFIQDLGDYLSINSPVKQYVNLRGWKFKRLLFAKFCYFGIMVVAPLLLIEVNWYHIVLAFLLMHFISGFATLCTLLPNHWDENAVFFNQDQREGDVESWVLHQLTASNDFAIGNPLTIWILGGLNYHVAHHIFPRVNHYHLPLLTKILNEVVIEYGLQYKRFTFFEALMSHFRLLKLKGLESYNLARQQKEWILAPKRNRP